MMALGSSYASVPTESSAPTGAPSVFISFVHSDPPTDAVWPWAHNFAAVTDPALWFPATPLLLPHHGSFARGIRVEPLADVDITAAVDEGAHGPTRTVAEEATVTIGPGDDWATMLERLLEHDPRELRWLRSRTSVRVVFEEAVLRDLVPALLFKVGQQHEQPLGDVEGSQQPTRTTGDAIGAGRDLHAGLRAVDDLRRWLSLSVAEIVRIAGLSESTVYWWAEHPASTPRPAKIDRLLGLQALAWGLVEDLGEPMTRRWFRAGSPSPLDLLRRDPGALPVVEERGYRLLQRLADKRLANAGPGRPVIDDDDQRDVDRLAEQEREFTERLVARELDPRRLEPEDLE
jgi:hypothetical protein